MYRGRFAPSPTGDLHLGSATTALAAWLCARAAGGAFVLRVEDLDAPRVITGMEDRHLDDLRWLGLDWDEGPDRGGAHHPYRQSERADRYEHAIRTLAERDLVYYCDCSRAEIARVASAPHTGEEGPRYPGTCRERGMQTRAWRRPPAIRLRTPPGRRVAVEDPLQGRLVQDVDATVGDFVLKRGDGAYAYQLACVVDDLSMGITEVVRGADLLASAPRQILLADLLGGAAAAFVHVPLVVALDGTRLAKRARGVTLRDLRERDPRPASVLTTIAGLLGLPAASQPTARDLLAVFERGRLPRTPTVRLRSAAERA